MDVFLDEHGNKVSLAFHRNAFVEEIKHVLVITEYDGKWLLTEHALRGLEFPGGKVELHETPEEAANREVFEETGGIIHQLNYIGAYRVEEGSYVFVKAIYFAKIQELQAKEDYLETKGPVLVGEELLENRFGPQYSFIMKDAVIEKSIEYIESHRKSGNA